LAVLRSCSNVVVREVVGDETLARELDSITNKDQHLRAITKRLQQLTHQRTSLSLGFLTLSS
jgi:hypothetical protein